MECVFFFFFIFKGIRTLYGRNCTTRSSWPRRRVFHRYYIDHASDTSHRQVERPVYMAIPLHGLCVAVVAEIFNTF